MILKSFIAFLPALLYGIIFFHLVWDRNDLWSMLLKVFLGSGIGLGINSCAYFFRLLIFKGQSGFFVIQIVILAIFLLLFWVARNGRTWQFEKPNYKWPGVLLALAAVTITAISGYFFVKQSLYFPHGDHDAYAIWNLHARFIYRGGENWRAVSSQAVDPGFAPDYPLLVPLNIAGGWNFIQNESLRIPAIQALIFTFGTAGLLFSAIGVLRTLGQASISAIILFSLQPFWQTGVSQLGDVPLAYYFLCSVILIYLYVVERKPGLIFLAGLAAGLSAWTKNEGIAFFSISLVSVLFFFPPGRNKGTFLYFLLGSLLPLSATIYFKIALAPKTALLLDNGLPEIFAKISAISRYWIIIREMALGIYRLGGWQVSFIIVLLLYSIVMGMQVPSLERKGFRYILFILLAQLASYFLAYLVTPFDLQWHLQYSLDRLLLHLTPILLFLAFLALNSPEKVIYGEVGNL